MFICIDMVAQYIQYILAYLGLGLAQIGPIAEARVHSGESGMDGKFILTVYIYEYICGRAQ
jgi:hypothetical protein